MAETLPTGKISSVLLRNGVIAPETLQAAELEARAVGVAVEEYLIDNNLVDAEHVTLAVSEYLGIPPITLSHFTPTDDLMELIPQDMMEKHKVLPVARTSRTMTLAMGDAFDIMALDDLQSATGLEITPLVAAKNDIEGILSKIRGQQAAGIDMEDIMRGNDADEVTVGGLVDESEVQSLEEMREGDDEGPVIRMVNMILLEAVKLKANDIHIEPQEDYVRLRYRVDGVLLERPHLPKGLQSAIISRIKIMSDLDIGEARIPQDGRFRIKTMGKTIDVRVSVLPTIFGGKVVLRTLDKSALFPSLLSLGLDPRAHEQMEYAIAQPHGIVLVTGPTGSGKTTTLYSCLAELNKIDVNVVTCEDPVEYQIPGIIQVRISTGAGCTFAAALRAILRQDPDIVLIGEIRDAETCEIAIKAALTGHLVLTTLHANDAAGTVTRLLDMGMEPFLLASSVILTQAQRLFRKLCPTCKKEIAVDKELLKDNGIDPEYFGTTKIFGPKGCPKCLQSGYKGRGAIMEVLPIDDDIRMGIIQQLMSDELREIGVKNGMIPLKTLGLEKVRIGETSLDTALRVTGD